jgi:protoporphyrinogen/coproporphyrinogen III oxidase
MIIPKTPIRVAVLGAGFSGLTLAWALQKLGASVEVYESKAASGGLIQTSKQKVLVEAAAHALLASEEVESLLVELDIGIVKAGHVSNSKWIFRGEPKKWPLNFRETIKALGIPKKPKPFESVAEWVKRNFNETLNHYLVSPGLQGIYGAQTDQLSARLVLGPLFDNELKPKKGRLKGSLAPLNGMSDLINKLTSRLKVHYNSIEKLKSLKSQYDVVVVATGIANAAQILEPEYRELSKKLFSIPKVSLLSATISFPGEPKRVRGFGCLFPRVEKFESLGVLFNSDIFPKRGQNSETWIFEGDFTKESGQNILTKILKDRKRIDPNQVDVDFCEIHRWPQVLPLYGKDLEELLLNSTLWKDQNILSQGAKVDQGVFLTGNYLGAIGLAKILSYNNRLAMRILKES